MSTNRFNAAIDAFDAYHRTDPESAQKNGVAIPKELLYAQRMTDRLASFEPSANEWVRLAARCQHIGRWEIQRDTYPMDRKGYLQWRQAQKVHHAKLAERILTECNYSDAEIQNVRNLVLKRELLTNPDTQLLEDVACLVFLEHYAEEFASRYSEEKITDILRKTFKKMSDRAKKTAGEIAPERVLALMNKVV